MSYSISVRGVDRTAIKDAIAKELDEQTEGHKFHRMDKKHVLKAVNAFVDLHAAPGENEQLVVNVSGAIGGEWGQGRKAVKIVRSAHLTINVRVASVDV
jgi:hypothetical protein